MGEPFDGAEEITDVDGPPAAPDITREYDWLAVFNKGVTAGRQDVIQALKAVMGDGDAGRDIEARVLARLLEASTERP